MVLTPPDCHDLIIVILSHHGLGVPLVAMVLKFSHYDKLCLLKPHYPTTRLKNHSSIIVLQLHLAPCNSYATTHYKYGDLINKFSHHKIS
jgi:hypothetical protein